MRAYKSPDKMSKRELRLVAKAAGHLLRHCDNSDWELQQAYDDLEELLTFEVEDD